MTCDRQIHRVSVFPAAPGGGNPCTIVGDARGMSANAMMALAAAAGHECCFILPPSQGSNADYRFRFFVPAHEMEMCGHATLGAAWLVLREGRVDRPLRIETMAGTIDVASSPLGFAVTQPLGRTEPVIHVDLVLQALGLTAQDLDPHHAILNAATSRIKTLIPLRSCGHLHGLMPAASTIRETCEAIGSTGLYPWATGNPGHVHARQFPKESGYLEDPATGIAAAALFCGLGAPEQGVVVHQGEAMGRPSIIHVQLRPDKTAYLISGTVELLEGGPAAHGML